MKLQLLSDVQRAVIRDREPMSEDHYDPQILLRRVRPRFDLADVGAAEGVVRGPVGGQEGWDGRGATQATARTPQSNGIWDNAISMVPSAKKSVLTPTESGLESDLFKLLDWAPNVKEIVSQPRWVSYRWMHRIRKTCPDFEVVLYEGRPHLLQVKYLSNASVPLFKMQTQAISGACLMQGVIYGVLSEDFIRQQPRLSNVKRLSRYRHCTVTAANWADICAALGDGPRSVEALIRHQRITRESLFSAIYRGALTINIDQQLSDQTEVAL